MQLDPVGVRARKRPEPRRDLNSGAGRQRLSDDPARLLDRASSVDVADDQDDVRDRHAGRIGYLGDELALGIRNRSDPQVSTGVLRQVEPYYGILSSVARGRVRARRGSVMLESGRDIAA